MNDPDKSGPVPIPVSGELDLHTFRPGEVPDLLPVWFRECRKKGIFEVRVIHGKGTGTLRAFVHAQLQKDPQVLSWRSGNETSGGWGATIVALRR